MINVSENYKTAIYDDSTQTVCTISYGAYDVTAKNLANVSASNSQSFSNANQTINTINNFNTYSDLELNNWVLDGNVDLFPNNPAGTEWGWWSLVMSNTNGNFATNPTLTYTWNENHTSVGITIIANDTLKQFKVSWYDGNNSLLSEYTYTNTDLTQNTFEIENGVANYRKIVIEFMQILPFHYVKIQDILFGKEFIWQDEIVSITVEESLDPKTQRLSSNQAIIKLNNIDNLYNKYDPNSKLTFLQEGQRMAIYNSAMIDGEYEQVPLGVFYLTSWSSPSQFTVEFKGNDLLYKMNDMFYYSKLYSNATLQTILNDVLSQYGNTISYSIDSSLNGVTLSGYIPIIDTRTALQHIAFVCGAVIKVNRYGEIVIKRLSSSTAVDNLDYSKKMFANDKEAERYNSVTLTQYYFEVDSESTELFKGTVTGNQILTFNSPASQISVSGTYTNYTAYLNCICITGASGTITVTGKLYNIYEKKVEKKIDDITVGITKKNMPVDSVYLIADDTTSQYVSNWLLNMLQKYLTNEFRWLSNPALEIGDFVNVQVDENTSKLSILCKNKFSFNGALSEISEVMIW